MKHQTTLLSAIVCLLVIFIMVVLQPFCSIVTGEPNHPTLTRTLSQTTDGTNGTDTDGDNFEDHIDTDDDNDNLPDYWEENWNGYAKLNNLNPLFNTKNGSDAAQDWDGDGYSNINEYISGTNPYDILDYPTFPRNTVEENYNWNDFLILVIALILVTMVAAGFIGVYIIRKRRQEDDFYNSTFGSGDSQYYLRDDMTKNEHDKFLEWQKQINSESRPKHPTRQKYKLEIIGGPDEPGLDDYNKFDLGRRYGAPKKRAYKRDPKFKGRYCLWCDKAITRKYIKKCTGMRSPNKRCPEGPFCSKKCLNEHLDTVPHYQEVNF
jgi:hypothetical protein